MTRNAGTGSVGPVSTPETPLVRVLDETGKVAPSAEAEQYLPLVEAIPDAELEQFYRDMVSIRAIDTQATNLQRQGQLALWPPSRGQEAAQVGSGRAARAHVLNLGHGVPPETDPTVLTRVVELVHGWRPE